MDQRTGSMGDFADTLDPGAEFVTILTEAYSAGRDGRWAWAAVLLWLTGQYGLTMPQQCNT